jgi:hypothetical protein
VVQAGGNRGMTDDELRVLLAQRRRDTMAQQSTCVTLDDGTLICVGEFGWFEVPAQDGEPSGDSG